MEGEYVMIKKILGTKLDIKLYKIIGENKVRNVSIELSNHNKKLVVVNPHGVNPLHDYNNEIQYYTNYSCDLKILKDGRIQKLQLKNYQIIKTIEEHQELKQWSPTFVND